MAYFFFFTKNDLESFTKNQVYLYFSGPRVLHLDSPSGEVRAEFF